MNFLDIPKSAAFGKDHRGPNQLGGHWRFSFWVKSPDCYAWADTSVYGNTGREWALCFKGKKNYELRRNMTPGGLLHYHEVGQVSLCSASSQGRSYPDPGSHNYEHFCLQCMGVLRDIRKYKEKRPMPGPTEYMPGRAPHRDHQKRRR
jgi:hypothetical protein